jgi:hypothetical protein
VHLTGHADPAAIARTGTEPAAVAPHCGIGSGPVDGRHGKAGRVSEVCNGCGQLAAGASTNAEKTRLLVLAERWLDLADVEDKRVKADHGPRMIQRDDKHRMSEEDQRGE